MLENYLRPNYQKYFVDPVARNLDPQLSPHFITFLSCVIGVAVFPFLLFNHPWLAAGLLLLSGYLDTLDGTFARIHDKSSVTGTTLDIISDRIVEVVVIIGLFAVDPLSRDWLCLIMLASCTICITTFLVVGIYIENDSHKGFHYSSGIMERAEAFLFFIAMMLFPSLFKILAITFIILLWLTSYLRIQQFLKIKHINRV